MDFIVGVLLFFLILRLLSWLGMAWIRRKIKHASQSDQPFEDTSAPDSNRKKIIDKDEGEYVDFEELD